MYDITVARTSIVGSKHTKHWTYDESYIRVSMSEHTRVTNVLHSRLSLSTVYIYNIALAGRDVIRVARA